MDKQDKTQITKFLTAYLGNKTAINQGIASFDKAIIKIKQIDNTDFDWADRSMAIFQITGSANQPDSHCVIEYNKKFDELSITTSQLANDYDAFNKLIKIKKIVFKLSIDLQNLKKEQNHETR